jgi:DNA-binding CsgD family transcriptional regulator
MKLLGRHAEREVLDRLLADALAGRSGVLVIRGDAGVGKTALLDDLAERVGGWRLARAVAVESEMELPYSALHQLSGTMLDRLDRLPEPQRDALRTVFGVSVGPAPDRFLVGLATLTLFADVADEQPLVCIVDDAQWLDVESAQILLFLARRFLAERIALVCAARTGAGEDVFAGLPEVTLSGLGEDDARALLLENVRVPLDPAVRDQVVLESHGNPLALLELPRTWNASELAGGFGLLDGQPVTGKIEHSYAQRLLQLSRDAQLLVLAASAEPVGDAALLERAAKRLGIDMATVDGAVDAGLLKVDGRIEFAHPLVRSAAYRSASADDRRRVHLALAEATDRKADPDRRAWHRAQSTHPPNDEVADELERSADRAQRRGGLAAAAAFLERAAALTSNPVHRGVRALDGAEAKIAAGTPDAASGLLATAELLPLDELQRARLERLKAQIAFMNRRGGQAAQLLLRAARGLEPLDTRLARATLLEAFSASVYAGRLGGGHALRELTEATRESRRPSSVAGQTDLLLESLALRYAEGYVRALPRLRQALQALTREQPDQEVDLGLWLVAQVAHEVWDDEFWHDSADRSVQIARDRGALAALPWLLDAQAGARLHSGRFQDAAALLEEGDAICEATRTPLYRYVPMMLAAWRGEEAEAITLIEERLRDAKRNGEGLAIAASEYTRAVLYNGLGHYEAAFAAAASVCEHEDLGIFNWAVTELVEAAARAGRSEEAESACARLVERTTAAKTDWALGMQHRSRALISHGADADALYRESLERLGHCRIAVQLARTKLLYGEWLRRENRRVDAREQLRGAYAFFERIGAAGFATRAGRELRATGEAVRRRAEETRGELTAQETQVARLAAEGLTNTEIGAQLFVSPRTVEWHLRKVFTKLEIGSRRQLRDVLPDDAG